MVNQVAKSGLTDLGKRKKKAKQTNNPCSNKTTNSVLEKTLGASSRVSYEVAAVGVPPKVSLYQQQQTGQQAESNRAHAQSHTETGTSWASFARFKSEC